LINALELSESRGIRACKEPIELSEFTVLIGRNNAGKTAILEALSLLKAYTTGDRLLPPLEGSRSDLMASIHGGTSSLVYGYAGEATITYHTSTGKRMLQRIQWKDGTLGLSGPRSEDGQLISREDLAELLAGTRDPELLPASIFLAPNDTVFLAQLADRLRREAEWAKVEKSGANVRIVRDLVARVVGDRFTEAGARFESIVLRKELPDGKVVEALLEHFNGEEVVLAPQDRQALGLEGSLALATGLIGRFGRDVLVVIDGDKFDEERFSRLLRAYFSSSEVEVEGKGYKRLRASREPEEARLCIAVMGARSIEEVEASLISELYGESAEPGEASIRRLLGRRGKRSTT